MDFDVNSLLGNQKKMLADAQKQLSDITKSAAQAAKPNKKVLKNGQEVDLNNVLLKTPKKKFWFFGADLVEITYSSGVKITVEANINELK